MASGLKHIAVCREMHGSDVYIPVFINERSNLVICRSRGIFYRTRTMLQCFAIRGLVFTKASETLRTRTINVIEFMVALLILFSETEKCSS